MGRPRKPIYGIAINDAPYNTEWSEVVNKGDGEAKRVNYICPYFKVYKSMVTRAYSSSLHRRHPSYKECSVDPRWHNFMAFREWMESQDWKGKQLDKDLLYPGNKVYGPETCCFIEKRVNIFIQHMHNDDPSSFYGVCYEKKSPRPKCQFGGRHVGYFDTQQEAHEKWRELKHAQANELADKQTDQRIAKALRARYADHSICCGSINRG